METVPNNKGPNPQCHISILSLLHTLSTPHPFHLVHSIPHRTRQDDDSVVSIQYNHRSDSLLSLKFSQHIWTCGYSLWYPLKDREISVQPLFIFLLQAPEVKV